MRIFVRLSEKHNIIFFGIFDTLTSWHFKVKHELKVSNGTCSDLLEGHLHEVMWRVLHTSGYTQYQKHFVLFDTILRTIAAFYPTL
jgi:hypothetical protein